GRDERSQSFGISRREAATIGSEQVAANLQYGATPGWQYLFGQSRMHAHAASFSGEFASTRRLMHTRIPTPRSMHGAFAHFRRICFGSPLEGCASRRPTQGFINAWSIACCANGAITA